MPKTDSKADRERPPSSRITVDVVVDCAARDADRVEPLARGLLQPAETPVRDYGPPMDDSGSDREDAVLICLYDVALRTAAARRLGWTGTIEALLRGCGVPVVVMLRINVDPTLSHQTCFWLADGEVERATVNDEWSRIEVSRGDNDPYDEAFRTLRRYIDAGA